MGLYDVVLSGIITNKQRKENGDSIGIPYPFPKLSQYVPLIERGHSIGFIGATGSGKSRAIRYIYLYHAYRYAKETGYKLKIVYFPLEDNKEKVFKNIICNYLKDKHGISISLQDLDSKGKYSLSPFVESKLIEAQEYFKEFESVVTILDGDGDPNLIFKLCKEIADNMGKVMDVDVTLPDGNVKTEQRYVCDTHVICIIDNLSNIDPDDGEAEHATINRFAKKYVRGQLCNHYHWTVVQVIQQDFESEKLVYNKDGSPIVSKLEPALSNAGDSKRVSRSMHLVLGMFNPSRYEIPIYPLVPKGKLGNAYDIDRLGNRFRSLKILKSNDSDTGMRIGLLFDGIAETFEELPRSESLEMEEIYKSVALQGPFIKLYE